MAMRNVGIASIGVITLVGFAGGYSYLSTRAPSASVDVQPIQDSAWHVDVEELSTVEDAQAGTVASTP